MRVFFVFLLIINLLISVWFYLQPVKNSSSIQPLANNIKTLVLLSEKNDQKEAINLDKPLQEMSKSTQIAIEAKKIDTNTPVINCYTLGPFNDEAVLQQARSELEKQVLEISERKREESRLHRYWVYLPSLDSRKSAIEESKKLAKAKINDYYIVRKGDKENAISLGHYAEKKYAGNRIRVLKKKGIDAQMEAISRQVNVFWLDYSSDKNKELSIELSREYLVDGVTRLVRNCD